MTSNRHSVPAGRDESLPSFLTARDWRHIVDTLHLAPQQARIFSLILQGRQDTEICAALDLTRSTIHTYLRRAFHRPGAGDRMELVLSAFALCQSRRREETADDGKDRGVARAVRSARGKKARAKKAAPI